MEFKDRLRKLRIEKGLTLQEVADYVGLQKAAIYKYEHGLVTNPKRGFIEKLSSLFGVSPSYLLGIDDNLPIPPVKGIRIPILGRVVAGIPLEAIENIEGWEEITPRMAAGGEYFALRIQGASMEPKLVDGDIVIVRKQSTVDNGDVAIVLVNGNEATCKQVNRTPAGITLIGFNVAVYAPHFYTNDQIESLPVTIVGKVVESRHTW